MSDPVTIFITSLVTIVGGVFIFSLSQIIQRFILEPIQNFHLLKSEIDDALVFYADIYGNPGLSSKEERDEGHYRLRHLASQLSAKVNIIWRYNFFAFLNFVPSRKKIKIAYNNLIGLSNSIYASPVEDGVSHAMDIRNMRNEIREALKINSLEKLQNTKK